jgi:hypothetical protein
MSPLRISIAWVTVVSGALAVGCGKSGFDGGGYGGSSTTSDQCGHDPAVGTGQPGACGVGGRLLDCEFPNGAGCSCMTTGTSCDGCGAGATCTDQCKASEYAVACGGIGPNAASADPPAACRLALATPAGVAFYCCPCL